MKKSSLFLIVCLMSCAPVTMPLTTPTVAPTASPTASATAYSTVPPTVSPVVSPTPVSTLDPSQKYPALDNRCPHLCWLGINPGVTSVEKAQALIMTSDDIALHRRTVTSIDMKYSDDVYALLSFEKGRIKSIRLSTWAAFDTLVQFFRFLGGEPDEIRITVYASQHCDDVTYLVYYASRKVALSVRLGTWNGPHPGDFVDEIILNTEFDDETLREQYLQPLGINNDYLSDRQPWLGFEQLSKYLPGRKLPTGPCVLPGAVP